MNSEKKETTKIHQEVNKEKGEKTKRKESFYAKMSEIKSVFYTNKPMFVLLYKEALLNINELDSTLPSVFSSLLQEFYSPRMILVVCHPRRQRSFNAKWRN